MSNGGYRFSIAPRTAASPALDRWHEIARRAHSNGGVFIAFLSCDPVPSLMRSKLEAIEFMSTLLRHPAVRDAMPGVLPASDLTLDELPDLEPSFVFHLDGDLTGLIHYGGAYWSAERSAVESRQIVADLIRDLFDNRWDDLEYAKSNTAWTRWFFDVAWDSTFLVIDRAKSVVALIVATDTD